jgi:hypothetical protein
MSEIRQAVTGCHLIRNLGKTLCSTTHGRRVDFRVHFAPSRSAASNAAAAAREDESQHSRIGGLVTSATLAALELPHSTGSEKRQRTTALMRHACAQIVGERPRMKPELAQQSPALHSARLSQRGPKRVLPVGDLRVDAGWDTTLGGIPCWVEYHAGWDAMLGGMPCWVGYLCPVRP